MGDINRDKFKLLQTCGSVYLMVESDTATSTCLLYFRDGIITRAQNESLNMLRYYGIEKEVSGKIKMMGEPFHNNDNNPNTDRTSWTPPCSSRRTLEMSIHNQPYGDDGRRHDIIVKDGDQPLVYITYDGFLFLPQLRDESKNVFYTSRSRIVTL